MPSVNKACKTTILCVGVLWCHSFLMTSQHTLLINVYCSAPQDMPMHYHCCGGLWCTALQNSTYSFFFDALDRHIKALLNARTLLHHKCLVPVQTIAAKNMHDLTAVKTKQSAVYSLFLINWHWQTANGFELPVLIYISLNSIASIWHVLYLLENTIFYPFAPCHLNWKLFCSNRTFSWI